MGEKVFHSREIAGERFATVAFSTALWSSADALTHYRKAVNLQRMATSEKFHLRLAKDRIVGPHSAESLRWWILCDALPPDARVSPTGQESWVTVSEVAALHEFSANMRQLACADNRLEWWSDPVTEKQLAKLRYFEISFFPDGMTKGRASELIECFIGIDYKREKEYQDRPATAEQRGKLDALGHRSDTELTYSDARYTIKKLELDEDIAIGILEGSVNDEDWRELLGYKKLNQKQLESLARYLREHPKLKGASTKKLAKIAVQLFPELTGTGRGQTRT